MTMTGEDGWDPGTVYTIGAAVGRRQALQIKDIVTAKKIVKVR